MLKKANLFFYINIFQLDLFQINKKERVKVRCRIHHWSTDIIERVLPITPLHWTERVEPLFKEEEEILNSMSLPPKPKPKKQLVE